MITLETARKLKQKELFNFESQNYKFNLKSLIFEDDLFSFLDGSGRKHKRYIPKNYVQ
jgi:hypothetical protein